MSTDISDDAPPTKMSKLGRLRPASTCLLICDVQEKFRAGIHKFPAVVSGAQRLTRVSKELSVPVLVTEQYPKGLGHTVEDLDVTGAHVFSKTDFTMYTSVSAKMAELKVTDAVLVGLEAHVCIQQTTLDLLEAGINVHLCVDAISSQSPTDRACGLRRSSDAGAFVTSTESVCFELMRSKDHPNFKAISNAVKETRAAEPLEYF